MVNFTQKMQQLTSDPDAVPELAPPEPPKRGGPRTKKGLRK